MKRPCSTERIAAGKSKVLHPVTKEGQEDSVKAKWCKDARDKCFTPFAAMMADKPYGKQFVTYTARGDSNQCYGFGSYAATQPKTESQVTREYNEHKLTKALNQVKNKSIRQLPEGCSGVPVNEEGVSFPLKMGETEPFKHLDGENIGFSGSKISSRSNIQREAAKDRTSQRLRIEFGKRTGFDIGDDSYLDPESHDSRFRDDAFGNA